MAKPEGPENRVIAILPASRFRDSSLKDSPSLNRGARNCVEIAFSALIRQGRLAFTSSQQTEKRTDPSIESTMSRKAHPLLWPSRVAK